MSKINLKDNAVEVSMALMKDIELLDLIECPTHNLVDAKKQILEDRYPNDLITNNLSRICVFEQPTGETPNNQVERGWVEINIYTTKEKNRIDRRVLLIAQRIIDLLDTDMRVKNQLPPMEVGTGLYYHNRLPNMFTEDEGWIKYGIVFKYDYILL